MTEHGRAIVSAFMGMESELSNLSSMARICGQLAFDVGSEEGATLKRKAT
jgi:hypothetical protein